MTVAPRQLLEIAVEAAQSAGALLLPRFEGGEERARGSKTSPTDLVSDADLAAERAIRELLAARRPDDGIVGEEEGAGAPGSTGLRWVVDPLDGTVNFLFGVPQWCVSVAVQDGDGALAGAIHDPLRDETFAALRGEPATLNGREIQGSRCADLATALVATGFAYDAAVRAAQAQVLTRVLPSVRDIRRAGSAALDLAWTSAGRYDAFYERAVRIWDIAAGALLCESAGLVVRELEPSDDLPGGILASPAGIADELLALVA